jgi:hypothetical protein
VAASVWFRRNRTSSTRFSIIAWTPVSYAQRESSGATDSELSSAPTSNRNSRYLRKGPFVCAHSQFDRALRVADDRAIRQLKRSRERWNLQRASAPVLQPKETGAVNGQSWAQTTLADLR